MSHVISPNALPASARRVVCVLLLLACAVLRAAEAGFQLDADYPGGNVRILSHEQNAFTVAPDLRDIQPGQWWFYYNFRLRGPAGQPATVTFTGRNPIGVRGPAVSYDGGRLWRWLGADAVKKSVAAGQTNWSFQAVVPPDAAEARFAFAPPYLESHLREWCGAQPGARLQLSELCRSRQGRSVEMIRAGCLDLAKARGVVLLTSRHHACESIATYALEGILTSALADDDLGRRWRERWQIIALPFADKDGVEAGDQGKNRAPHDHNRDYNHPPLYPEVAAWMKLGESLKDRVVFSLDLHCPTISGKWNDRAYIVGSSAEKTAANERAFVQALEQAREGPIPFRAADCYLPSGVAWNTPANYAAGRSSAGWARDTFPNVRFAATIEIAYADALGVEVNASSARALGRDLARAILAHLDK